jgi:phage portal protein BeeE
MLWPLDWSQINAWGLSAGAVEWWSTFQFDGQERFIAVEDTMHFAWPGPSGSEIGVSPLEKLGTTIALEASRRRIRASMPVRRQPAELALIYPQTLKREQRDQILSRSTNLHTRGTGFAAKTLVMNGGADVKTLSMTPVEAQLMDQRKRTARRSGWSTTLLAR